jgi:hypothetical protein
VTAAVSAHARYGSRLAALAAEDGVLGPGFERLYARFHPHRDPFATLVLRDSDDPRRILRVEAFENWPAGEATEPSDAGAGAIVRAERGSSPSETLVRSDAGWLRLTAFPSDPALRTLPALLARSANHTVVRYRPYRRCTVRFALDGRDAFAKVFADDRGERIHRVAATLWAAGERGELAFSVPRPERFDRRGRTLWQSAVAGLPAREELLGQRGTALARLMGTALASLAAAPLSPQRNLGPAAVLMRAARLAAALVRSVPALARPADELLGLLRRAHAEAPRQLVPVHGDPHAGQWLSDRGRLGLVDFDGLALGHPELDVAAFLSALRFEDRTRAPLEPLCAAFLTAYEEAARPLDPRLIAIYLAYRRLAKAVRVASSLRPDGDRRAERHLERALEELGGRS